MFSYELTLSERHGSQPCFQQARIMDPAGPEIARLTLTGGNLEVHFNVPGASPLWIKTLKRSWRGRDSRLTFRLTAKQMFVVTTFSTVGGIASDWIYLNSQRAVEGLASSR